MPQTKSHVLPLQTPSLTDSGFNSSFLMNGAKETIDIQRFNKPNAILPGDYLVDLLVDKRKLGRAQVTFKNIGSDKDNVHPCISRKLLKMVSVNFDTLSVKKIKKIDDTSETCLILSELIPQASTQFDISKLQLGMNIPQANLLNVPKDYVDPELWNDGVPAVLVEYTANYNQNQSKDNFGSKNGFLGLRTGANYGSWRLRHTGNLTYNNAVETTTRYTYIDSYLQRSIPPLKRKLVLGDTNSDGRVLDSFPVRGFVLASDDRMLPPSQRGYAPTIHGAAFTNALVQIRQNNSILYETNVSPGPFSINDLYTARSEADLEVIVTEADGRILSYTVPYASAPAALREGTFRYSVVAGKYRDTTLAHTPYLAQGVLQYGLTSFVTAYGGGIVSDNYNSGTGGVALNTDIGTLGIDATYSSVHFENSESLSGESLHLNYSTAIFTTETNIGVAAYHFATRNFFTLPHATQLLDLDKKGNRIDITSIPKERNRLQIVLNQNLWDYGTIFLAGSSHNYWDRSGSDYQYQLGYSQTFGRISLNPSASRVYSEQTNIWKNNYMTTVSIPIGQDAKAFSSTSFNYNDVTRASTLNQSIAGIYGDRNQLTYNVGASYADAGINSTEQNSTVTNGNISYIASSAALNASASMSQDYHQGSVGMSGTMIGYNGGLVLSSSRIANSTVGIIEAKDAVGAKVLNGTNVEINASGLAIVPNMSPFSINNIGFDPKGLPMNISLDSSMQTAIPSADAVLPIKFKTDNAGRSAIIRSTRPDGDSLPFASDVFDEKGMSVGIVGQDGLLILRHLSQDIGILQIKWGNKTEESCLVSYHLPVNDSPVEEYRVLSGSVCLPQK
ncbi:fimbria/pilus outer membrane usher protein [Serratia sp. T13T92]|uniref:fimbria/pilus outer membrane usher protein n=1 Tax=Serratia sp. T13T92 TaxID=3397496 RepID=UPI0039DF96DF